MALIKHISSKNANYDAAIDYLMYEHDELSTKSQPEIHKLKAIVDNFN